MIDRTISCYRILENLGEGGMGVVYKAQDTKLGRIVALKFLSKDSLRAEGTKARFVQEAKTASAPDHPNVATIYEIDEVADEWLIFVAYLEAESRKGPVREGTLSIEEILMIAIQRGEGSDSSWPTTEGTHSSVARHFTMRSLMNYGKGIIWNPELSRAGELLGLPAAREPANRRVNFSTFGEIHPPNGAAE